MARAALPEGARSDNARRRVHQPALSPLAHSQQSVIARTTHATSQSASCYSTSTQAALASQQRCALVAGPCCRWCDGRCGGAAVGGVPARLPAEESTPDRQINPSPPLSGQATLTQLGPPTPHHTRRLPPSSPSCCAARCSWFGTAAALAAPAALPACSTRSAVSTMQRCTSERRRRCWRRLLGRRQERRRRRRKWRRRRGRSKRRMGRWRSSGSEEGH